MNCKTGLPPGAENRWLLFTNWWLLFTGLLTPKDTLYNILGEIHSYGTKSSLISNPPSLNLLDIFITKCNYINLI